jgi:hypothetical protein
MPVFTGVCEYGGGLKETDRRRDANEDHFLIATLSQSMQIHRTSLHQQAGAELCSSAHGELPLVADGIDAHVAGERASKLEINAMS